MEKNGCRARLRAGIVISVNSSQQGSRFHNQKKRVGNLFVHEGVAVSRCFLEGGDAFGVRESNGGA